MSAVTARRRTDIPIWLEIASNDIPPAPPCFDGRDAWVSYVQSAQMAGDAPFELDEAGNKVLRNDFDFCEDCSSIYRKIMCDAGRCKPNHLKGDI